MIPRRRARRRLRGARPLRTGAFALVLSLGAGIAWAATAAPADHPVAPQRVRATAAPRTAGGSNAGVAPAKGATVPPPQPLPDEAMIDVPPQDQYPQLPNGCEVTALSMLLTAVGHPVSRFTLAREMPLARAPRVRGRDGAIVSWGDPNVGFVGSVWDAPDGYGIYHGPLLRLLDRVLPGAGENLGGGSFVRVLRQVASGVPVEVWTTADFRPTTDWITWQSPQGPVRATLWEHAVLVVGYHLEPDGDSVLYVNNPLNGRAAEPVPLRSFLLAWDQLGRQAISVHRSQDAGTDEGGTPDGVGRSGGGEGH